MSGLPGWRYISLVDGEYFGADSNDGPWFPIPAPQPVERLRFAPSSAPALPADVARCPGEGFWEVGEYDWRKGCEDCLRRTSPGGRVTIQPPKVIVFECEYRIGPGEVVG